MPWASSNFQYPLRPSVRDEAPPITDGHGIAGVEVLVGVPVGVGEDIGVDVLVGVSVGVGENVSVLVAVWVGVDVVPLEVL
jgi:hypothetical protein